MEASVRLRPYVARLAVEWLADVPDVTHRALDGTLAFVDVSGFTALTERLAARGKEGAEEIGEILDGTFAQLLDVGYEYGAGLVKFGGDATLLFFSGDDHARRACRATALMCQEMRRIGRLRTSAGPVTLRVSVGVHSGVVDFFLVGSRHRELIVCGPAATETARMEAAAAAGQVVVSPATAARLAPRSVGTATGSGFVLRGTPAAAPLPARTPPDVTGLELATLLPARVREHLQHGGDDAAHRYAGAAFVEIGGVDAELATAGGPALAVRLTELVDRVNEVCDRYGVTFLGTDLSVDAVKVILLAGVPEAVGNDERRLLRAGHDLVTAGAGRLGIRGGVNAGRMYVGDFGPSYRRAWSVMGDAVNLAARLMARAPAGGLLASEPMLAAAGRGFRTEPLPPFLVKGKSQPVHACEVVELVDEPDRVDIVTPLLGRDTELALLLETAAGVADGGAAVDVVGAPGVGKSRLVQEAVRRWDLTTLTVSAADDDAGTPYLPVRRLLRQALGCPDRGPDDGAAAALAQLFDGPLRRQGRWRSLVEELLGLPTEHGEAVAALDPKFRPVRLAETVRDVLSVLLAGPTAIVVEDAHALDDASAGVLATIAAATPGQPWLLLTTRRSEGDSRLPAGPHVRPLALGPLPDAAAAVLLDLEDDTMALPRHEQRAILARAGGNPLFLRALARARLDAGAGVELPDSLDGLLAAQIDRLAPPDRRVLRTAAVLGVRFDESVLTELLPEGMAVDDALWQRLASYVSPDGPGRFRFDSALVRDAAYEGLSFRARRALHATAAVALRRLPRAEDDNAALLSLHYFHAQDFAAARELAVLAADRAVAMYANAEAVVLLDRALRAARKVPGTPVAPLLVSLGRARYALADFEPAAGHFADAATAMRADPLGYADAKISQAAAYEMTADWTRARVALRRARAAVAGVDTPAAAALQARATAHDAWIQLVTGDVRRAAARGREAVVLAERSGDAAAMAFTYGYVDFIELRQGHIDVPEDETYAAKALALHRQLGNVKDEGLVLQRLAYRAYFAGRWDDCVRYREQTLERFQRVGDEWAAALELTNVAEMYIDRGVAAEAQALLQQAHRVLVGGQGARELVFYLLCHGRLLMLRGAWDEALVALRQTRARAEDDGLAGVLAEIDARIAECLAGMGNAPAAADLAAALLTSDRSTGLRPLLLRVAASAAAQRSDSAAARRLLEDSVATAQQDHTLHEEAFSLTALVGLLAADDPARDEADARRAELFTRLGIAWPLRLPFASATVPVQHRAEPAPASAPPSAASAAG